MNPGQTEGPITFPLTIRTTNKNIDEMLFKCPIAWTVSQLKLFIGMNHKNGSDFMRSDKLKLIYQGRILIDEESLSEILKHKNIQDGVLIIAYTQPKQAPNQSKEAKISASVNEMLFKDYGNQLTKYVTAQSRELNKNIKGLDLLSILPMRAEKFTGSVLKLGATPSGQAADFLNNATSTQQAQQQNNQPAANLDENEAFLGFEEPAEREALDFNFHFKMIVKLAIFLFIFAQYFKGFYLTILLVVVAVYYWMKMKAIRVRRRRFANQRNNNAPQLQNNENPEARDNQGQQSRNAQQNNVIELKGWNLTWARTKELCICFVCSLFPAWNVEIYIEERRNITIAQNPPNNIQNNAQNNPQPINDGANLPTNLSQNSAEVQNREQVSPTSDNLFETQSPEEKKEQPEHEQKKESTKEVELIDLQRFESKDSMRNDPLLD